MKVLTRMYASRLDRRGLGDAVQFNIVLKHIRKYKPDWELSLETTNGKESCHYGFVKDIYLADGRPANPKNFDKVVDFTFAEPNLENSELCEKFQAPATKPTVSIVRGLEIIPDPSLFKYEINIPEQTKKIIKNYMESIPNTKGIVTLHYRAASSPHNKDIEEKDAIKICDLLLNNGYTPLILDWKGSGIPDQKRIFCASTEKSIWQGYHNGDAATIAAIIEQSKLFIGVDSGPLHLAGCTKTPSIGYWKYHHPVHYFDFSENVLHLLPCDHRRFMKSINKNEVDNFFQTNYKHKFYSGDRGNAILDTLQEQLNIEKPTKENKIEKVVFPYVPIKNGQWWPIKL